ncbi:hypothetical protein TCAL_02336 [Tigriopus californicus]|uniref:Survival of motor neuron-related-splicing factor 30 n=1 Tax=Tigriopus californicus TaxID=6832 RepID=A0A553NX13_TIGCA|nr:tudor domain-containing protein 3-like [Tigriopus californicus]TRY69972.1 hypothetical protein TCAL_02336 [Tigriopus californicus]|eukprot:TCALIF_02336-PA protein Name:"Similar to tdrd3 Tudor domain-containing protein 3 (Xenopus tropicalis)" AED:0.01 eAED:0.01 QI:158/1/1/1/1/1/2/389/690
MKALLERGWRVSASSQEDVPHSAKESLAWALHTDMKEFGEAFVVDWLAKAQEDSQSRQWVSVPPEGLVLQVSRVRNVAAPKIKEDAASVPKLHKISLTDGHGLCHAIEKRRIESISSKIPPGTKVRLQPGQRIQCKSGFLLLEPGHVDVLGGKVEALLEKWAISQELAHFTRAKPAGVGGPPPWVAFGKRIGGEGSADAGFKALPKGETDKDGVVKESVEFESQRKDAIEEAARQGGKKVFGGGTKEVKDGDRRQHNNRYANKAPEGEEESSGTRSRGRGGRGGRGRRGGNYDDEDDESGFASSRPSTGVSLFSFLEKELPESAKGQADREPKPNRQGGHTQGGPNRTNYRDQPNREFQGGNSSRRDRGGGHSGRDDGFHGEVNQRNGNHRDGNPREGHFRDGTQRDGNQRGRNKRGRGRDSRESQAPSRQLEVAPRHERQGRGGGNRSTYDRDPPSFHPSLYSNNEPHGNPNERAKRGGKRGRGGSRQPQDDRDFGEWENSTYTNAKSHPPPPHHGRDRAPPTYAMNDLTEMMHGATMNHPQPPPPLIPPLNHHVDPKTSSFGAPPMVAHGEATRGQRVGGRGQSHSTPRPTGGRAWKEGDLCLAKYWEDGQFYMSQVTAVGQNTVVVLFPEYGNHEEVLLQDLKSLPGSSHHRSGRGGGGFSGRGRYPSQAHPTIAATPGLPPAFPST